MADDKAQAVAAQLGSRQRASGLTCPKCGGGRTQERSLLAWRQDTDLRAKCKRAKCGWYFRADSADLGMPPVEAQPQQTRRYQLNTLPLTEATVATLQARYRVLPATVQWFGLREMAGGMAAYCPVLDPCGRSRGWVRRWLDDTLPKVKSFPSHEHPPGAAWCAWFMAKPGGQVVCVEDVFSAMRLWQEGINAVALLGVSLTPLKVAELRRYASRIVVALDADAFTLAISAAIRFHIEARRIEPDIKDMTEEQLDQWITDSLSWPLPSVPAKHATPLPGLP
jgi:hypothetical protein